VALLILSLFLQATLLPPGMTQVDTSREDRLVKTALEYIERGRKVSVGIQLVDDSTGIPYIYGMPCTRKALRTFGQQFVHRERQIVSKGIRHSVRGKAFLPIVILIILSVFSPGAASHQVAASRLEVGEVQQDVDLYRKGNVTINIIDEAGNPLSGLTVGYAQVTHDFLFGVGLTNSEDPYYYDVTVFELLKDAGVNYALPYLTWELTARSPSWVETAYKPRTLHDMGYTLTGHCLVWFYDQFSNLPSYAKQLTFEELKQRVKSQIMQVVDRYRAWIHIWEISEPNFEYSNSLHLTTQQWIEICKLAATAIREADPDGKVLVNMPIADVPEIGYFPIQFLRTLAKEGVQFDIVGLELYGNGRAPGAFLDSNGYPVISWVSGRIDEFSQLGKPIFLSEIGVPSKPSEETQAEWLKQVYTLAFSKPHVQSVTWYNIYAPQSDTFYPDSGLFRTVKPSSEPKLAYYSHKELVSQWTTTGTGKTDENGALHFRGYAGEYEISVAGYENSTIHVSEARENVFTILLRKVAKPLVSGTSTAASTTSTVVTTGTMFELDQWLYSTIVVVAVAASTVIIAVRRRGKGKTSVE